MTEKSEKVGGWCLLARDKLRTMLADAYAQGSNDSPDDKYFGRCIGIMDAIEYANDAMADVLPANIERTTEPTAAEARQAVIAELRDFARMRRGRWACHRGADVAAEVFDDFDAKLTELENTK